MTRRQLVRDVARRSAELHGVAYGDVVGTRRDRTTVAARHEAWRELTSLQWSTTEIGAAWGVHASTVQAALRRTVSP